MDEFHICYSHTEWNFLFSLCENRYKAKPSGVPGLGLRLVTSHNVANFPALGFFNYWFTIKYLLIVFHINYLHVLFEMNWKLHTIFNINITNQYVQFQNERSHFNNNEYLHGTVTFITVCTILLYR